MPTCAEAFYIVFTVSFDKMLAKALPRHKLLFAKLLRHFTAEAHRTWNSKAVYARYKAWGFPSRIYFCEVKSYFLISVVYNSSVVGLTKEYIVICHRKAHSELEFNFILIHWKKNTYDYSKNQTVITLTPKNFGGTKFRIFFCPNINPSRNSELSEIISCRNFSENSTLFFAVISMEINLEIEIFYFSQEKQ